MNFVNSEKNFFLEENVNVIQGQQQQSTEDTPRGWRWWQGQCTSDAGQSTSQGGSISSQPCRNDLCASDVSSPDDVQRIARGREGRL